MQASDIYEMIVAQIYHWGNNFHRNLFHMFDDMNMTRYIRLIACVGAYLLLRPYFVKIGTKIQEKEFEKQSQAAKAKDPYEAATIGKVGEKKITPNSLREGGSGKKVSFEGDKKEEADASGKEWGGKAKLRQKKVVDGLLEAKEKRLREDDEEEKKDVLDLLKDYDSGEDGW